jgi:hypothetical protein
MHSWRCEHQANVTWFDGTCVVKQMIKNDRVKEAAELIDFNRREAHSGQYGALLEAVWARSGYASRPIEGADPR